MQRKLWQVDPGARQIIQQCLKVDPDARCSTRELLQHPYFSKSRRAARPQRAIRTQGNKMRKSNNAKQSDQMRHQMEGRQSGVLDISLSQRVDAVIEAFQESGRKNPTIERVISHFFQWTADPSLPQFLSPQNHDVSTQRFESVLMAINAVEKVDPRSAREFLYILHQTCF